MKFCILALIATLSLSFTHVHAQTMRLKILSSIELPQDSVESKNLTTALDGFLVAAQKPNEENTFIFEPEKIETFVQLDEVNGIEKSEGFKDDYFYKPYLDNVVLLNDNRYLLQVSYIGVYENTPILRASFEFIAHKINNTFTFSSPLVRNTKQWKIEKVGNNIFHYQHTINKKKTIEFNKLASSFDSKLKAINKITDFYCSDNAIELQKLTGVMYKLDYNGRAESVWSASLGDKKLIVLGNNNARFDTFDPHDLFHDRLSLVIPRRQVNKSVDEGCAYLYGGSWGFLGRRYSKPSKSKLRVIKIQIGWT